MYGEERRSSAKSTILWIAAIVAVIAVVVGVRQLTALGDFNDAKTRLDAGENWLVTVRSYASGEDFDLRDADADALVSAARRVSFAGRASGGPYRVYDEDLEVTFFSASSGAPIRFVVCEEGSSVLDGGDVDCKVSDTAELYDLAWEAMAERT